MSSIHRCARAGLIAALAWLPGVFPAFADTFIVSNRLDSGAGSLRQAILDANANPGTDTIAFNISGAAPFSIVLAAELPEIVDPVMLDGTTQPGFAGTPLVVLTGSSAPAANGLTLRTTNCDVRGLVINRFKGDGLRLQGGGGHVVRGNFIGTSPAGDASLGNRFAGVTVIDSAGNYIGGTNAADRNLISGNQTGVYISGTVATGNIVCGNYIGTDAGGTRDIGNTNNGVLLYYTTGNKIGGSTPGARNVISANNQSGVYLYEANTFSNQVCGNFIGTTASGTAMLSNVVDGVTIFNAPRNLIGGSAPGEGNVISGNHERGIFLNNGARSNRVEGNVIGLAANGAVLGNRYSGIGFSNSSFNVIGGTNAVARNVISGNQQSGVAISDSACASNTVAGNFIGVDLSGTHAAPNGFNGITVLQGIDNVIGGIAPAARNVISGNGQNGIQLQGGTGTLIAGNFIGPDVSGGAAVPNAQNGIRVDAAGNMIGGSVPGSGNVISGNGDSADYGVALLGAGASNNVVAGNLIGTDATGAVALGNSSAGIGITNAPRNQIGGTGLFDGNVISGNGDSGIFMRGTGSIANRISGNLIGTDVTGLAALPNAIGGIYIYGCPLTQIGGVEPGAGNVISGNSKVGLSVGDVGSSNIVIQGNVIGLQRNGTGLLGNEWHGVELIDAANTTVGGTVPGAGNRIGGAMTSGYDGVRVRDTSTGNSIRGNSMFGNGGSGANGLGIDLGVDGVTLNDAGDADTGANLLQNFPVITSVTGRCITRIAGTLNSRPNSFYLLDFYGNTAAEPGGYGEGERWLGTAVVATGISGNANFVVTFTNLFGAATWVTGTSTDVAGNTSEFSLAVAVVPAPDTDHDGIPDDYEIAVGLNPNSGGSVDADSDGDGRTDLEEFAAGTNARDALSVLQAQLERGDGYRVVTIPSVSGRTYDFQTTSSIAGTWTTIAARVAGNGLPLRIVDQSPETAAQFYRVVVNP